MIEDGPAMLSAFGNDCLKLQRNKKSSLLVVSVKCLKIAKHHRLLFMKHYAATSPVLSNLKMFRHFSD